MNAKIDVKLGLSENDYAKCAQRLNCEIEIIKAVSDIEARGSGFLPSKRPKILFEGHYFYRNLRAYGLADTIAKTHPTVCYPKWTKSFYKGGESEYSRLNLALEICRKNNVPESAALKSASWGRFQIMGANFEKCGYSSAEEFVEAMFAAEGNHLLAFSEFVINSFLDDELRNRDFARFAAGYNGPDYAANQYDKKMKAAYDKYKKESSKKPHINVGNYPVNVPEIEIVEVGNADSLKTNPSTEADKPAIALNPLQIAVKNIASARQLIVGLAATLGLSGTSMTALNFHWFSNPNVQVAILIILVTGIIAATVLGVVWLKSHLDFQHQLAIKQKEAEREYNLETLRIRSNPNLYNVEYKSDV